MVRRTYVAIEDVKPGMILDQAILNRAGRVLVARNVAIEPYQIQGMMRMEIPGVYIREGEEEPQEAEPVKLAPHIEEKYEEVKVEDPAKVELSESLRERVAEGVQFLYQDTNSSDFIDTTQSITTDLMKAIESNNAIAVDISALKVSDEYTFKHSVDVATMSMVIAQCFGFSKLETLELGIAGLLHDIGKSQIPNKLLNKASRLSDAEFEIMKQHSVYGYHLLKDKEDLSNNIKMGVLQHHEKKDGSGYPMNLNGDQIHEYAKIISIVDIYDALVTERPYKKPFTPRDAVEMIMSMTGELDIVAMRCFLESVILYPVGTDVELSNGEKARVIENSKETVLRPKVLGLTTGKIYDLAQDLSCANIIIL